MEVKKDTSTPLSSISCLVSSSFDFERAISKIENPFRANCDANCLPIPSVLPVTTEFLPSYF